MLHCNNSLGRKKSKGNVKMVTAVVTTFIQHFIFTWLCHRNLFRPSSCTVVSSLSFTDTTKKDFLKIQKTRMVVASVGYFVVPFLVVLVNEFVKTTKICEHATFY